MIALFVSRFGVEISYCLTLTTSLSATSEKSWFRTRAGTTFSIPVRTSHSPSWSGRTQSLRAAHCHPVPQAPECPVLHRKLGIRHLLRVPVGNVQ